MAIGADGGTQVPEKLDLHPGFTLREDFVRSPAEYHSRPLWFWNKPGTTPDEIREIITQSHAAIRLSGPGVLKL